MEDIILRHPAAADAAVIARPDPRWGETPLALVVPRPEAVEPEREIVRHVKEFVTRGVLPKEAVLVRVRLVEAIPRTSVGKTDKLTLRAVYLDKDD